MLDERLGEGTAPAAFGHLQQVLRGIATGIEPSRLLHQVVQGAAAASAGRSAVLVGRTEGSFVTVASTDTPGHAALLTAQAAATTARPARRADDVAGRSLLAVPVRAGGRAIGGLAVSGDARALDHGVLSLFADAAAAVLAIRPTTSPLATELLEAMASAARELDHAAVLSRLLDSALALFGATGGFAATVEAVEDGGSSRVRVVRARDLDRERIREASEAMALAELLAAPGLRVEGAGSTTAALLSDGLEAVASLPLRHPGSSGGHLVLLFAAPPDAARRGLLTAFARAAAAVMTAPELRRRLDGSAALQIASIGAVSAAVVAADEAGRFLFMNARAAELFSLSDVFEVGRPVAGRLGHAALEDMLLGEPGLGAEVVLVHDGVERVYATSARTVLGTDGRLVGRVLVLEDQTASAEVEQTKSDFLAVLGHELRTPLTIVKGSVRTLARRGPSIDASTFERTLDALSRNTDRLERLLEDMLFVAAVEDGRSRLRLGPDDLGGMVDLLASDRITVRRPPGPLLLTYDRPKVGHVLYSLVDNALKYSEGQVVVEILERADEVEVAVIDHGPGIFSGDLPLLFQRFRQLDGSSTRASGGTGLGLYIARRIVEAHDGRIWCESRLGHGSRFAFVLPKDQDRSDAGDAGDAGGDQGDVGAGG